jgi:glycyl-tRNA synthetase beta chain
VREIHNQPLQQSEPTVSAIKAEIYDYIMERARAQYLERASDNGISTEMFDAVLATRPASLLDFDARLRALVGFVARPEGVSLAAANKRIANILRKSEAAPATAQGSAPAPGVAAELLREDAERELHQALLALREQVAAAVTARDYARALDLLAGLKPAVDGFFDRVLVNDLDDALRKNRLALLAELRALFSGIADLSRLPG